MNETISTITITRALIMAGSSTRGGSWNAKQMLVFGIPWPQPKGWLSRLVGTSVPKDRYDRFLSLKKDLGGKSGEAGWELRKGSFHSLVGFLQQAVERSEVSLRLNRAGEVELVYCDRAGELKTICGPTMIDIAEQIGEASKEPR